MSIVNDYKKVSKAQSRKSFTFTPDTMVKDEREFSEALFQFADKNNLNLVITKEGMYPVFEIDGVEYTADRRWRMGRPTIAYIACTMTHPEEADDDKDIPAGRRKLLRYLHRHMGAIILMIGLIILRPDMFMHWWGWAILIAFVPIALWNWRVGE